MHQGIKLFFLFYWISLQTTLASLTRLKFKDPVTVSVNKVFRYFNSVESYPYYMVVPFCKPDVIKFGPLTFSQLLRGDRHANSPYNISYLVPVQNAEVCRMTLDPKTIRNLKSYIDQSYTYEIFIDDLPVSKPLGFHNSNEKTYWIPSHIHFYLGHNDGHVVSANVSITNELFALPFSDDESAEVIFRYSVSWFFDSTPPQSRIYKQLFETLSRSGQGLDIRWIAITNSFIFVLFIFTLLMVIILKIVRVDIFKYIPLSDEELTVLDEPKGWKCLYGDVSRAPPYRMWFCGCIGAGAHLFLVITGLLLSSVVYNYIDHASFLTSLLFVYLLTSSVSGYISAYIYRRLGGIQWKFNILVTVSMFMGPVVIVWFILNLVANAYQSTRAFPFSITFSLFLFWLFITLPLTVVGGILGRYNARRYKNIRTLFGRKANRLAREIPRCSWKQSPWIHIFLGGFISFVTIYVEFYFIFISLWGPYSYILLKVLLCAACTHLMVSGVLSVLITYYHLNLEDYRWWWRSLFSGGCVGIYFLISSLMHLLFRSKATGFFHYVFFIGFSLLLSWGIFLIDGFVTFSFNYLFISYIYSTLKAD